MLQRIITTNQVLVPDSLSFEPAGNAVWAVTPAGDVDTARLLDERVDVAGTGYVDPVAVVPLADGLRVAVAEADGTLWVASRDAADRNQARALASVFGGALAAHRHPDPDLLLVLAAGSVDGGPAPQLVSCSLETGDLTAITSGLAGPRTFVVDLPQRQATVLAVLPDDSRTLTVVNLDDGSSSSVTGLGPYDHLTTSPDPARPGCPPHPHRPGDPGNADPGRPGWHRGGYRGSRRPDRRPHPLGLAAARRDWAGSRCGGVEPRRGHPATHHAPRSALPQRLRPGRGSTCPIRRRSACRPPG